MATQGFEGMSGLPGSEMPDAEECDEESDEESDGADEPSNVEIASAPGLRDQIQ
jgi:hypothetical protein